MLAWRVSKALLWSKLARLKRARGGALVCTLFDLHYSSLACLFPCFLPCFLRSTLFSRFGFIIYLKHAPSFGDSCSSCTLNTPPHLATPVHHAHWTRPLIWWNHHISTTRSLIRRLRFSIYVQHTPSFGLSCSFYLKHVPPFGDSGSSYILNTRPHLEIPVQHISTTRRLIWRFRFSIYLQHTASFGDSGSSYILNTHPHLAIPAHPISSTCTLILRFRFSIYLQHAPSFGESSS